MRLGIIVALLLAGSVSVWAETVGQQIDDKVISAKIDTTLLLNDRLSPFSIKVSTYQGIVTLSGGVSDPTEKQLAEDLARAVKGVRGVDNRITVLPAYIPRTRKRGFRQKAEDLTVSAKVRAQLLYNSELKGLTIGVKTVNNVTTLSGVVDSQDQKKRIGQLANETSGVDRVINNLTVVPRKPIESATDVRHVITDQYLADRIRTRIILNRYISIRRLDVNVRSKECILTGTVDTAEQKELAGSIAENTPGIKGVRNDIHLRNESSPEPAPPPPPPSNQQPKLPPLVTPSNAQPAPTMKMLEPPHNDAPKGSPSVQEESLPSPRASQ